MSQGNGVKPMRHSRLLASHGLVLRELAVPGVTIRMIASNINLTERRVMAIIAELDKAGFVNAERGGRRNVYSLPAWAMIIVSALDATLSWEELRGVGVTS